MASSAILEYDGPALAAAEKLPATLLSGDRSGSEPLWNNMGVPIFREELERNAARRKAASYMANCVEVARCAALAVALLAACQMRAQEAPANASATPKPGAEVRWSVSITVDGYLLPDRDGYVNPNVAADHGWLHLEARYNYEDLRTGSVWIGYNFSAGKEIVLNVTPMIGGVFGQSSGIAPGCEASLSYKHAKLSISNEYVFDVIDNARSFYYSWPEATYSPTAWLRVGLVAQRTKAFKTKLDTQRGFLVGFSHRHAEFTAYVFNPGWTDPTVVLEVGWSF